MLRVWAPAAKNVQLIVGQNQFPLAQVGQWWRSREELEPGTDYFFSVDGSEPLPDPRSPWQPAGVKGPSRVQDHSQFQWHDAHWRAKPLGSAVLYELHIGTFTPSGTFESATEKLEHLVQLGVTHVEIMPVAEFLGERGWGYDGVFPYAPHHHYGGPQGLKRLIDACHQAGLAVILDVVYNHLGPSGNCLPRFGPYFSTRHSTNWGSSINFDGPDSDEVRRYFCDNAAMWLRDYHFDGLRIDAVHAIVDTSATAFLEQLALEINALQSHLGRHLVLIAESDLNDPRLIYSRDAGGFGLDAQWSDDIHHSLHSVLTGERAGYYADFGSLDDLAQSMKCPFVYAGRHSGYRRRRHGRTPEGLSATKFVACLQNHDQVGNRPNGDRITQLVDVDRAKIGAALILLSPYVPMLFQGEEWGSDTPFQYFVDFADEPALEQAVASGRRKELAAFGWAAPEVPNPAARSTFERSKLNWSELSKPQSQEMLDWYRQLIALRRQYPALTDGRLEPTKTAWNADEMWFILERPPIVVLCNFADQPRRVPARMGKTAKILLLSAPILAQDEEELTLAPHSVVVCQSHDDSVCDADCSN